MRGTRFALLVSCLLIGGCNAPTEPTDGTPETPGEAVEAMQTATEEAVGATDEPAAEAPESQPSAEEGEVAEDTFEAGVYTSPQFNVRFTLPEGWTRADVGDEGPSGLGTSDDSITFVGPDETGLRLVVANSESIQLVDSSFDNVTETIGFDQVRIVPDASQARTFNGIPGYRTEADAHLRGEPVPQYIVAQALELPGQPTMFTVFVPGDQYDLHKDDMFSILDSIEVLNARQ